MAVAAPVARTGQQTTPQTKRAAAAAPVVPFQIAALTRSRTAFDTGNLVPGQNVAAIEIPAAGGFLKFLELQVTLTTAGNSANVTFAADGPFNALSFIEFMPPSGDPPIVPHTGYQLMLWNKYGAFSQAPPYADPRRDPNLSVTTGTGATGGSAAFTLRLPFEIDPATGFCSITNSAANKSYLLNLIVNTTANIYGTAPTNAPTVRVIGEMYYWDEPQATTRQGTTQQPGPVGLGSFSQLRLDTPVVAAGDKTVKVNNAGPVLRALGVVLRTVAGARTNADLPATWDFMFNTRDRFLIPDSLLQSDMAEAYGYQQGTGTNGFGTAPNFDAANGLDTGVRFFPYFGNLAGGLVRPNGPRSQYQVTADATLTQIRAISFGANASVLEILSNLIRPTDAAALYNGRIS
jgi:hypothetical protein